MKYGLYKRNSLLLTLGQPPDEEVPTHDVPEET